MTCVIRPSNVRVYQFRHLGTTGNAAPTRGGTEEGSRTHTPLRALAPEASASTDSATSAARPAPRSTHGHPAEARRHVSTSQNRSDRSPRRCGAVRRPGPTPPCGSSRKASGSVTWLRERNGSSFAHALATLRQRARLAGRDEQVVEDEALDARQVGAADAGLPRGQERVEIGVEADVDVDDARP